MIYFLFACALSIGAFSMIGLAFIVAELLREEPYYPD